MEIKVIVIIVIMFFSMIQSLTKASKEKQEKAAQEKRRAEAADPNRRQRVQSEIESFLSEVTGQRAQNSAPVDLETEREQERRRQASEEKRRRQLEAKRRQKQQQQRQQVAKIQGDARSSSDSTSRLAQQEQTNTAGPRQIGSNIGARVQNHIGQQSSSKKSTNAVSEYVDTTIVKSVNEHLGRRSAEMPPPTTVAKGNMAAANIADLLRSPAGIRNAILVNELLSRPRALRTKS